MDSSKVMQLVVGASVQGVPLIVVVMALVQYFKKLGLQGRVLLVVSMATGLALGAAYQAYVLASAPGPGPATPAAWYTGIFSMVIYGLLLGLVASGAYDVVDETITQAVARLNPPAAPQAPKP